MRRSARAADQQRAAPDQRYSRHGPAGDGALDLDLRVVHHDYNIERLRLLFEHYASGAATSEHLGCEYLLTLRSQLADKSTDDLIAEFSIEPMRDYPARVRRNRQRALKRTGVPSQPARRAHPQVPRD